MEIIEATGLGYSKSDDGRDRIIENKQMKGKNDNDMWSSFF